MYWDIEFLPSGQVTDSFNLATKQLLIDKFRTMGIPEPERIGKSNDSTSGLKIIESYVFSSRFVFDSLPIFATNKQAYHLSTGTWEVSRILSKSLYIP